MIRILDMKLTDKSEVLARSNPQKNVAPQVAEIIDRVRREGDKALFEYTRRFDKADLASLQISETEMQAALDAAEPGFKRILEEAAANIRAFHEKQKRTGFVITRPDGTVMGQKLEPLRRVGLYVPGGTAVYPSTVLMDAIPAKLAGVNELVIVTPPRPDGSVNGAILAAAYIAGVDRIYKLGGAQAIAALAYGTETIPRVDKIVGPGNAFVTEAKRQVFGQVAIDMIAGPSEIMIVADGAADPRVLAADLLSQAEHDKNASAVLLTDSSELACRVQAEIEIQLDSLERNEIARASIDSNGKIIITESLDEALEIVNELAPEHLELCVDEPFELLGKVENAGSVFLGRYCPEALGDYLAGPNHTLPTLGTARFSSPLSVDDFIKKTQFTFFTRSALAAVADDVACFARKEGLTAHARSALIRTEEIGL